MFPRLLVLVNMFLSIGLLAWALTLSSNRLDWVDAKTDTGTTKGQITLLKEEIDRTARGAADLSGVYVGRTKALATAEAFRAGRQVGYADRLARVKAGQFQASVPLAGNPGFVDLSRVGAAEKGPDNQPLRGTDAVQKDIDAAMRDANRAIAGDAPLALPPMNELDEALANNDRYAELTAKLGLSDLRKLQETVTTRMAAADQAVLKQKEIRVNLRDEAQQLAGVRVNWRAQLFDLQDRQGQLSRRLAAVQGKGQGAE